MFYMKHLLNSKKAIVAKKPTTNQSKTSVSAPKIKPPTKKLKTVDSAEKSRLKNQKLKPSVLVQKTKSVGTKKPRTVCVNLGKPPIKQVKSLVSVKAETKSTKLPIASVKKIKVENVKLKAAENKTQKPKSSKTKSKQFQEIKSTSSRAKVAPFENKIKPKNAKLKGKSQITPVVKAIEIKVEPKKLPLPPKPKKKKAKPICAAVFRGKKDRYGFEVFPLDAEFEDVSAIYVISKRKIDKRKKGHHALVCIGQTESLLGEIKRHKQGKCVKKYQANVISILPEENEKKRLRIETDLKAAHTVVCNLE